MDIEEYMRRYGGGGDDICGDVDGGVVSGDVNGDVNGIINEVDSVVSMDNVVNGVIYERYVGEIIGNIGEKGVIGGDVAGDMGYAGDGVGNVGYVRDGDVDDIVDNIFGDADDEKILEYSKKHGNSENENENVEINNYQEIEINVTTAQYNAITYPINSNEMLVIDAGPGAGKTRTLVNRICYLIDNGTSPSEILALSMTNRAVNALRSALEQILGEELADQVQISTFHGFCTRILIDHGPQFNTPMDWQVMGETGWRTLHSLFPRKAISVYDIQRLMSSVKKSGAEMAELARKYKVSQKDIASLIDTLAHSKVYTYDDIVNKGLELIQTQPQILEHVSCVMVDEFQDIYPDLLRIVKGVAKGRHLTIAGDPHQSIYGFLNSDSELLSNIGEEFGDFNIQRLHLPECFRSTPEIIEAAEMIVADESTRVMVRPSGLKPYVKSYTSPNQENEFVAAEIMRLLANSNGSIQPNQIAILAKTNNSLTACKKILETHGLRAEKLSAAPIWVNSVVYYLVDYLTVIISPEHDFSLICAMSLLPGVGPVTLKSLYSISRKNEKSLWDTIVDTSHEKMKITSFVETINRARTKIHQNPEDPKLIMAALLEAGAESGFKRLVERSCHTPFQEKELRSHLADFYTSLCRALRDRPDDSDMSLAEYFIWSFAEEMPIIHEDAVNLSTIHSAKGLEFPVVFVLGGDNGWSALKSFKKSNLEENRLLYVAFTRASNFLYVGTSLDESNEFSSEISERMASSFEKTRPNSSFFKNLKIDSLSQSKGGVSRNLSYSNFQSRREYHSVMGPSIMERKVMSWRRNYNLSLLGRRDAINTQVVFRLFRNVIRR